MAKFDLSEYATVNERIVSFYKEYPEGSLQSEIVKIDDQMVVVKAFAFRDREDPRPAVGHAEEKRDSSYINKTSALENCETSAVGRALAMLGFEVKKSVASREEVENAVRQQNDKSGGKKQPKKTGQKPEPTTDDPVVLEWQCDKDSQGEIATYLLGRSIDIQRFFSWLLSDKIASGEIPGPIVTQKLADYLVSGKIDGKVDEYLKV